MVERQQKMKRLLSVPLFAISALMLAGCKISIDDIEYRAVKDFYIGETYQLDYSRSASGGIGHDSESLVMKVNSDEEINAVYTASSSDGFGSDTHCEVSGQVDAVDYAKLDKLLAKAELVEGKHPLVRSERESLQRWRQDYGERYEIGPEFESGSRVVAEEDAKAIRETVKQIINKLTSNGKKCQSAVKVNNIMNVVFEEYVFNGFSPPTSTSRKFYMQRNSIACPGSCGSTPLLDDFYLYGVEETTQQHSNHEVKCRRSLVKNLDQKAIDLALNINFIDYVSPTPCLDASAIHGRSLTVTMTMLDGSTKQGVIGNCSGSAQHADILYQHLFGIFESNVAPHCEKFYYTSPQ